MTPPRMPSENLIRVFLPLAPVPFRPDLRAHQAPDVFALWEAWEKETGGMREIPFWAAVWPAAQALARYLAVTPEWVEGRTVLDLGCGSGVAGIAAAKAGAGRVIANDIDPMALAMTLRNAAANGVELSVQGGDFLRQACPENLDAILVGDLFYEKAVSEKLLDWLQRARKQGKEILISDASRPFGPKTGVRMLAEESVPTNPDLEGSGARRVRILTLDP